MKALIVDQFGHIGGGQMCLLDLLPAFPQHGWQVDVSIPVSGPYAARLVAGGASVNFFGDSGVAPIDVYRQAAHLSRAVRRTTPDLIYVNGPRVFPAAALATQGVPILFHAHSHVTSGLAQTLVTGCMRARNVAVVACSGSVAHRYQSHIPSDRLAVIPNGVPDHGYHERFRGPVHSPRIGIIGRIVRGKGHLTFLQCARRLMRTLSGVRFVICGSLSEAGQDHIALVKQAGEGLPIDWLGWREDIGEVLHDLDLLVIPSAMEGLPRVMLEAFSSGVPVVAFPVGGIPDAIRDAETGFLVEPQTGEALAEKVEAILCSYKLLHYVSSNARRLWADTYTVERYRLDVMAQVDRAARQ